MGAFINYKSNIFPNLKNLYTTLVSADEHTLWVLSCKVTNRGNAPIRFNLKKSRLSGTTLEKSCYVASTSTYFFSYYDNGINGLGATLTNSGVLLPFIADDKTVPVGARVLMKDQTDSTENGIYTVSAAGDSFNPWILVRSSDYDTVEEVQKGDVVFIENGDTNAHTLWVLTNIVNEIGEDALLFAPETSNAIYLMNELEIPPYKTVDIIDYTGVIMLNFDRTSFVSDNLICFSNGYTQLFDCDVGYAELKEL